MHVGGCLLLITIVAWSFVVLNAEKILQETKKKRHILPLLGFLEGYKIGQNFALQLPPFVLTPIVVVPSVNQQQTVNIHGNTEDNLDESGNAIQVISPAKLILSDCNHTLNNIVNAEENLVEETSTIEPEILEDSKYKEDDMFKQSVIGIENPTNNSNKNEEMNYNVTITTESTDITFDTTLENLTATTVSNGVYPTAIYKNEIINTLTFTERPTSNMMFELPSTENKWQNFSSQNNIEDIATEEKLESRSDNTWSNAYPTAPSYNKYPYPMSYSNVDNTYITNTYHSNLQYPNNDRWQTYYSPGKQQTSSQFRPLAGLYYDGFLHQSPVKKSGFIPYYNNNYY